MQDLCHGEGESNACAHFTTACAARRKVLPFVTQGIVTAYGRRRNNLQHSEDFHHSPESQDQNLFLTGVYVSSSLESGRAGPLLVGTPER
jgi:hypothetical protein